MSVVSIPTGQIYSSAHSAVYKILFGGAADGAVRAYKIPTGETLWTALGHTENVNALIASEFLEFVISASADGSMRAWDIRNGTPRWSTLVFPDKSAITAAACAEWEKKIVAAGENGSLVCLDASDGRELWRTTPQPFGFLSLKIQAATDFSGVFARFNLGHMLMTEDHEGVITVRDLKVWGACLGDTVCFCEGGCATVFLTCVYARMYVCMYTCVCMTLCCSARRRGASGGHGKRLWCTPG